MVYSNTGSETHTLKCCEFAGWDSEEQFSFGPTPHCTNSNISSKPQLQQTISANHNMPVFQNLGRGLIAGHGRRVQPNIYSVPEVKNKERLENGLKVDTNEDIADNGKKNAKKALRLRAVEKNLKILPGEKVSITVGCQAK